MIRIRPSWTATSLENACIRSFVWAFATPESHTSSCRLPAGPAVLAVETGAPLYVLGCLRDGAGDWEGYIERIEVPASGSRHERVRVTLDRQVAAFEGLIARAPEQWWTLLFRIWEDIPQA